MLVRVDESWSELVIMHKNSRVLMRVGTEATKLFLVCLFMQSVRMFGPGHEIRQFPMRRRRAMYLQEKRGW